MRNGRRRAPRKRGATEKDLEVTPAIQAFADEIKAEFVSRRAGLVDGAAGVGAHANTHFIRAAHQAIAHGETAAEFVAKQLEYLIKTGANLYPQAIGSSRVTYEARKKQTSHNDLALAGYRTQLDKWERYISFGSAADVLRLYRSEFSPLFCFLMATRYNLHALAAECRDAATAELRAKPVAQEVFGDLVEGLL